MNYLADLISNHGGLAAVLFAVFLVNLAFGFRSQLDAWCERNRYAAGVLKILRSLGVDPWMFIAGVGLILKGRLPTPSGPVVRVAADKSVTVDRGEPRDDDKTPSD